MKLQTGAGSVLFINRELTTMKMVTSISILSVFQLFPIIFYITLKRKKDNLSDLGMRASIGTLYQGLKIKSRNILFYSPVFLVRRSLFVLLTFILFDMPNMQIQVLIVLNLAYISYVSLANVHEW